MTQQIVAVIIGAFLAFLGLVMMGGVVVVLFIPSQKLGEMGVDIH